MSAIVEKIKLFADEYEGMDCLDRNVHSVTGKDPWERFIIELDDMINDTSKK